MFVSPLVHPLSGQKHIIHSYSAKLWWQIHFPRKETSDRKRLWETIARNLVKIKSPKFKTSLSERSVRERYMRIAQRYKTKMNEEIKASGISPNQSELDVLLEELTEREEMAEEERFQHGKNQRKINRRRKKLAFLIETMFVFKFLLYKWWLCYLQWLTNSLKCSSFHTPVAYYCISS